MSEATKPASAVPAKKPARQPEKKIGPFANGVGVSIWLNTTDSDGGPRCFRSITINPRRYFDRESNEWRDAASFNPTDLPALIFALEKAQEYVFQTPLPGVPVSPDGEKPEGASGEEIPF